MTTTSVPIEINSNSPPEQSGPPPSLSNLRRDLDLYRGTDSLDGHATWVVHDKFRNKYFNIGQIEYEILRRWSLNDAKKIVQSIINSTTYYATEEDVEFLDDYLIRHELVYIETEDQREKIFERFRKEGKVGLKQKLFKYIIIHMRIARPDQFLTNTLWIFKFAFTKTFWSFMICLMGFGTYLVMREWTTFKGSFSAIFSLSGAMFTIMSLGIAKLFHEFGHAYACKYYGLKVPTFGFRLMMFILPFFYTDTADSWRLRSRKQRVVIGLSGMLSELILATFAITLWGLLDDGFARSACFYIGIVSMIASIAINSTPFLKWDGYYIFSDLIGVQNLQMRGFELGKWQLREWLFGWKAEVPTRFSAFLHKVVVVYAYGSWVKRFFIFIFIGLMVYQRVFKVLGILLLSLQFSAFVLMPITKEIGYWIKHRSDMRWNIHSIITFSVFIILIVGLVAPWQSTIKVASIITPRVHAVLYTPIAANAKEVFAKPNMVVKEGQLLVQLGNVDLEYKIRIAKSDVDIYQTELNRFGDLSYFESREISFQQLQGAIERTSNLIKTFKELEIRAPFDGEIISVKNTLQPGNWFKSNTPIITIADKSTIESYAYLPEQELIRIDLSQPGVFYPENPLLEPIHTTIIDIDKTETQILRHAILSSTNGGSIDTVSDRDKNGRPTIRPLKTHYRIRLAIDPEKIEDVQLVMRGTLHLAGEKISIIKTLWNKVVSILIRESGF